MSRDARRSRNLEKYLQRHAEAELPEIPGRHRCAVVVPMFDESQTVERCVDALRAAAEHAAACPADGANEPVLVVAVVNAAASAPASALASNRRTLAHLQSRGGGTTHSIAPHVTLSEDGALSILTVNSSTDGRFIPPNQGVGAARKLGADIALAHFHRGRLRCPQVLSTDADARIPPGLLSAMVGASDDCAACTWPWTHRAGSLSVEEHDALMAYELHLRVYTAGLETAQSPWAFHTIGSALSFDLNAYVAARGFPKRAGGEDFYLLRKLALLGVVRRMSGPPIEIVGRFSARVPFGTGPALRRMLNSREPRSWDHAVFELIAAANRRLHEGSVADDPVAAMAAAMADTGLAELDVLVQAIEESGLSGPLRAARKSSAGATHRRNHALKSFDAFRTMRLARRLESMILPAVPLDRALAPYEFDAPAGRTYAERAAAMSEREQRRPEIPRALADLHGHTADGDNRPRKEETN